MSIVILIGRILLALLYLGSGINGHLLNADATAAYGEMRGLRNAKLLVQVSGVLITLGALGVLLGVWIDLAALGLAVYTFLAAVMIHHFWRDEGEVQMMEMTQFMKNLALTGGLLALFGFTAAVGDQLGFTITEPLFDFNL